MSPGAQGWVARLRGCWPQRLRHQLMLLLAAMLTAQLSVLVLLLPPLPVANWVAVAGAGAACLTVVGLYLRRALSPLQRLAKFSAEIGQGGGLFAQRTGSSDVAELADALNEASLTLGAQMNTIRSAEGRTQAILDAVPDVIFGLDDAGSITVVNPSVTSIFGLEPEQARGQQLSELLPGLTAQEVERRTLDGLFMRSSGTHTARFESEARRRGGTVFPVEVSLSRTETPEGRRYAAVVRDLTEQRMNFEMLNLYSRALECTTNGVVIADMQLPGQPLFYANPAFCKITGYEAYEVIGSSCGRLRGDDVDQPEFEELRQAIAESRSAQVVLRNYRKDGTLFFNELSIAPVPEPSGSVRHYVGVINDVTERERSRMAIAERSARLNAVFDLSPDGFVVFDGMGQLVYCNPAFLQMTGWDQSADLQALTMVEFDRRFALLCDPTQPAHPVADVAHHSAAGAVPEVLSLVRPEHRMLARMARSTRDDHGETILFFRDITRESEVDRMKSEFLTTAAHELRTPMVSVFGFTELLLRRPVPEERRRDMLETIHRQASLLINMVNELLDLARIEARQGKDLRREPCQLDSILTEAVGPLVMQTQGSQHQLTLRLSPQHAGARLMVDPEKTNRALTNVLSNAVKYSPNGGSIVVDTVDGRVRGEPAVGLRVTDQGLGMTPEQLARVFERFYRADPSGNIPGTGLGMSLVKEIVELQGGQVELQSQAGAGTAVTLWLPLLASPNAGQLPALPSADQKAEVL